MNVMSARWRTSAWASSTALCIGAYSLVSTHRVGLAMFGAFVAVVFAGPVVRDLFGGTRQATASIQLAIAAALLLVAAPHVLPIPALSGSTEESWRFIAHLMLIPAGMLTVDLSTRASRGMTIFSGMVLLAAAGSIPGSRPVGAVFVAFAAASLAALALLDVDSDDDIAALVDDVGAENRSRRTSLRRAGTVGVALLAIMPLAAALRPAPPTPASRGGQRDSDSSSAPRYGGFSDTLDTSARFKLSDEVVLRVRADAPDYWRGTTFDTWDGRTWTRSESTGEQSRRRAGELPVGFGDSDGGEAFDQTVTVVAGPIDVVFGAYRMVDVDMSVGRAAIYDDGTLRRLDPLGDGAVYTVHSRRPLVTADLLRAHDPLDEELAVATQRRYLQLPSVPARVRDLAAALAADQRSTYDTIRAMERWMGEHTTYTLDIPRLPRRADAVDQYLFVDQQGFCEQIASSLAVMLRSLGVPTRVATGYVAGEFDELSGQFTVRDSDAHAWVEVFFPGVGWQAFDPTASVPLSGEFDRSLGGRLRRSFGVFDALKRPALVVAVLGSIVAAAVVVVRRRRRPRPTWAALALRRLEREGRRRGRTRAPNETPVAYVRALIDGPWPQPQLLPVATAVNEGLYSLEAHGDGRVAATSAASIAQRVQAALDDASRLSPAPPWYRALWSRLRS
jgi:transglutaminase-like putative cysteine protease